MDDPDEAIHIPLEAVEVALEAFAHASGLGIFPDDENDEEWREDLQSGMRAAIRAVLRAWPEATIEYRPGTVNVLRLPMTEPRT